MNSARRLWWVQATMLGAGAAGLAIAVLTAARLVAFELPSLAQLAAACRSYALPEFDVAPVFVLVVSSVALASVMLTARSALRHGRAARRLRNTLPVIGTGPGPTTLLLDDSRPLAFCAGIIRPRIYVSRGAMAALSSDEMDAVLAHELHHLRRRDPLRLLVARSLGEGLFFLPALRRVADRYASLAEIAADEAAVRATGSPRALAAALLVFEAHPSPVAVGIAPERVDHLLGVSARWELPALLLAGSAVTVAAIVAVSLRVAASAPHVAVGLPQLAAQVCMLAMAIGPVLLGAAALLGSPRMWRPR